METLQTLMGDSAFHDDLLKALASTAAAGTDASPLIKEDLEVEAHNQLWNETDPNELVILKLLPKLQAYSVIHEFDQVYGYGNAGHDGFYGEDTLPGESNIQSRRKIVNIRLMGTISSVFALANFQTPIRALGQSTLVNQNMAAARLNLMRKMAVATYSANDGNTLHTLRFKGLRQQILEGTSVSTSAPYTVNTDYIVDLRGAKLTPVEIRRRATQVAEAHGNIRWLCMAPQVSRYLEETLDAAERLQIPRDPGQRVIMGQNIGGMSTNGLAVNFAVDNTLTARHYGGPAPTVAIPNVPAPLPSGNIGTPTVGANASSLWVAADAHASVVYSFTALNAFGESTATTIAGVAVAAGDIVTIAITPRAADTSYRVYRATGTETPQFIREVIGTGNTTPFNFVDTNSRIPGTTEVYGLNVTSDNSEAIRSNNPSAVTLYNPGRPTNTAQLVTLGPWMGIFELAHILQTASRDLVFSAFAPEVTHPFQNIVWTNVGDR